MPVSNKKSVQLLIELFKFHEIKHIVFSPGSRNAPFVLGFANDPYFETTVIHDERVAGFFALGLYQSTGRPVAVCCTSGSAAANYLPSVTEAFYQHIPLILLTADRPKVWIDQGDGQTIRQENIFQGHVGKSINLLEDEVSSEAHWYNNREVNLGLLSLQEKSLPLHINVPFSEPLYEVIEKPQKERLMKRVASATNLPNDFLDEVKEEIKKAKRPILLIGQQPYNTSLNTVVKKWTDNNVVVLVESLSNIDEGEPIQCIDRLLIGMPEALLKKYQPDLLITVDGAVVSKKVKSFLRNAKLGAHIHISSQNDFPDTYQQLTHLVSGKANEVLGYITPSPKPDTFYNQWQTLDKKAALKHQRFVDQIPFSDFKVFSMLFNHIPPQIDLQLGNSTVVRYAQLFENGRLNKQFCNRGTSGIDGSMSTSVGYCVGSGNTTLHITGDMSFYYDSNALGIPNLPKNLKILLIQNGGGGIFRFIPGPGQTPHLDKHFEATYQRSAEGIAKTYGLDYRLVENEEEFIAALPLMFDETAERPLILEVNTPRTENDIILKEYFKYIHHGES